VTVTSTQVQYNPFAPDFYTADPFAVYRAMREGAPVYRSDRWGWWALTRFDDVREAILDPDTFRSFEGMDIDDSALEQAPPGSLPNMDNPRHDEIRRIVQPYFLPRRVADLEAGIRSVVRSLVESWQDRGAVDLAEDLAWPMPFDVFFHVMGLPGRENQDPEQLARREQLERWTHELKDRVPGTPHLTPVARAATAGVQHYFIDLLEERRRHGRDDLATHFVRSDIDGKPFVREEVTPVSEVSGLMLVLYLGGVESTAGLTGTLFKLLAENPGQRALLQQDPSLIPAAIEEALRLITPLQLTARTAMREVTFHGVTIPAGGRVVLVTGAANRDERQFPDPDTFDITRSRSRHLGFGEGIHGCLGAPLARLEARIALEELRAGRAAGVLPQLTQHVRVDQAAGDFRRVRTASPGGRAPRARRGRPAPDHERHPGLLGVRRRGQDRGQTGGRRWGRHARPARGQRPSSACLGAGGARRPDPGSGTHPAVLAVRRPGRPSRVPRGHPARPGWPRQLEIRA
jgi:cytochrome P450